jgi:hypothetical protein
MRYRWFTVLAVVVLTIGWFARPMIPTVNADSGTLSTTNTTLTYTHGPFFVANMTDQAGPPVCTAPDICDDYGLNVDVPAGTDSTQQINVTFTYDQSTDPLVDFDLFVLNSQGNIIASNTSGVSPSTVVIPAISGSYTVRADPWFPGGETYTGTISLVPKATTSSPPPSDAAAQSSTAPPRFQDYPVPSSLGGNGAGEPSIGVNWNTGNDMYVAGLQTFRVGFDDSTSPAAASWKDVSALTTSKTSLDPILYTDRTYGRTFVSQLTGQDSLTEFTDNDGTSWTPSQGGGIPSGADHQTIGAGPYSSSLPSPSTALLTGFKDAVYYCSQDIASAFCARSDNGGLTFGAGVPIYNMTTCAGIHGHVKVAPDGTVYVPARSCSGKQAVAVSTDDGTTWTVRQIPDSTAAIGNDPSVGIATDGTVYFGYQGADGHARVAISHDRGTTWTKSVDVGALAGVQGSVFPAVVAGDPSRASFAFLGTQMGGDFQSQANFNGVWYLYNATTYDGGKTWSLANLTPNDPVQRGSICISGTLVCNRTPDDRNLLDFIGSDIDSHGNVNIAYADGCISSTCVNGTGTYDSSNTAQSQQSQLNDFTALASISRQSGGLPLFSKFDPAGIPSVPARPRLSATQTAVGGPVTLSWKAPDNGGSAITNYYIYKGTSPGSEKVYQNVGTHLSYQDTKIKKGVTYYYYLVAKNAVGSSQPSPEVSPVVSNSKPMCTLPGQQVVTDNSGDQVGAPSNADLDILGVYAAEPANTNDLAISMQVSDLSSAGAGHQWRLYWDYADQSGNRWYVGMDTGPTGTPSFIYGTNYGVSSPVKYAPGTQETSNPALAGSGYNPDTGIVTIVVPKDQVGSPAPGSTLPNVQGRTFSGQGDVTATNTLAVDTSSFGTYGVVGNSYCG